MTIIQKVAGAFFVVAGIVTMFAGALTDRPLASFFGALETCAAFWVLTEPRR